MANEYGLQQSVLVGDNSTEKRFRVYGKTGE
jgi:hypothetical protein